MKRVIKIVLVGLHWESASAPTRARCRDRRNTGAVVRITGASAAALKAIARSAAMIL
jgi:hypothetical protein